MIKPRNKQFGQRILTKLRPHHHLITPRGGWRIRPTLTPCNIHGSLGPHESAPQHLDRFSRFCTGNPCGQRADRQTDRPTYTDSPRYVWHLSQLAWPHLYAMCGAALVKWLLKTCKDVNTEWTRSPQFSSDGFPEIGADPMSLRSYKVRSHRMRRVAVQRRTVAAQRIQSPKSNWIWIGQAWDLQCRLYLHGFQTGQLFDLL